MQNWIQTQIQNSSKRKNSMFEFHNWSFFPRLSVPFLGFFKFLKSREKLFLCYWVRLDINKKKLKKKNKLVRSAAKPNNVKLQPSRRCWLDRPKHHWLFIQLKTLAGVLSWPTIRIFQNILHTYLRPTFKSPNHRLGSKKNCWFLVPRKRFYL